MANPNIVNVTSIYGTTYVQAVGVSATAIATAASSTVVKLDALYEACLCEYMIARR